jgi:hypothetical protein
MAPERIEGGHLRPTGTLGTFGCSAGARVVRVGVVEGMAKGPHVIDVTECPACGQAHPRTLPTWRKPTAYDEGRGVDLIVDEEGRQA